MARLPEGVDLPGRRARSIRTPPPSCGSASPPTTLDALELTDFLKRVYVDRLATVPGVATVYIGGERRYAMRIWVDRTALAARGLTVLDIESAIKQQNVELPGGRIASTKRELTVKTDSRLADPGGVRAGRRLEPNGYLVRLGEVAKVEVGARGRPLRVLQGRQHRARPRHRAPVDRQHARGRRRRPGRAREAQAARCRPAPKRTSSTTSRTSSAPRSTAC